MITLEGGIFILIIIIALIYSAIKTSDRRRKIKERANLEYEKEIELTEEELENRLGESELMYEELEQTYWIHNGVLIGVATYFYWHIWYISVALSILLICIGIKYLSLRPFTTGMVDRRQ